MARNLISIENTRFIFETNFAGNPKKDKFRSTKRKGNIVIPDPEQAQDLLDAGYKVKATRPRDGEEEGFEPTYYVPIIINMESEWPPKIYLVSGDSDPQPLDADTVGEIDKINVENVDVVLSGYNWGDGRSLYVKTMYVEQGLGDDPFAAKYARRGRKIPAAEREYPYEEVPFR